LRIELFNIKQEEIISYLKEREPLKVDFHRDADGVYSAALLGKVFKLDTKYLDSPEPFGNYNVDSDVGLDFGSPIEEYNGLIIDHHSHEEPTYKLIWGDVPTGLIVYTLFRDKLEYCDRWKVCGSLVGDGRSELIPVEIWDHYPELLEGRASSVTTSYGNLRFWTTPIYKLLSSCVNSMCRLGNAVDAVKIVMRARTPEEIVSNPAMINDINTIRTEESRIFKELVIKEISSSVVYVEFKSPYWMVGRIASRLMYNNSNCTFVVVNKEKNTLSIRGDLASWIGTKLAGENFKVGGHPGYYGGTLDTNHSVDDLLDSLRRMVRRVV